MYIHTHSYINCYIAMCDIFSPTQCIEFNSIPSPKKKSICLILFVSIFVFHKSGYPTNIIVSNLTNLEQAYFFHNCEFLPDFHLVSVFLNNGSEIIYIRNKLGV